jgi:hypothetical protein
MLQELIADTKKHIFQEYSMDDKVFADIKKANPQVKFTDSYPTKAPKLSPSDQAEVIVLSLQPQHHDFIVKVAEAINKQLAPTVLITNEDFTITPSLKLIVAPLSPKLHSRIKTRDKQSFIEGVPVILMRNIDLYSEKPELKKNLWNALIQATK